MKKTILDGITVLDFGNAWAGPLFARTMGDMGARVIKVESRRHPDVTRALPPWVPGQPPTINNSGYFSYMNRSKLSVSLNIARPEGRELAQKLIGIADILVENFAYGVMDRLGLGYEPASQINPRIIYVSMTALGSKGPISHYAMYGRPQVYLSGLAHTTGHPDQPPHPVNISYGDPVATHHGLVATLAALHYREKTGEGQFIELSQNEGLLCFQPETIMDYMLNGRVRGRQANRDEFMAPHNVYRCQGGPQKWVAIAVSTDEEWQSLCRVMGDPDWAKDEKFADQISRWKHQEEMDPLIEAWTANYTDYAVTEMLQQAGVAAFPCLSNRGLVEDPHLNARDFFQEWDHPEIGRQKYDGMLWKMSKTPVEIRCPAPLYGQHNNYVFGEILGLPQDEIDRLVAEKVLY